MIDPKLVPDLPAEILLDEPKPRYKTDKIELPDAPLMYAHFGGVKDMAEHKRLKRGLYRVKRFMADGRQRTLAEISKACGVSEGTAGARMRDFRKPGFGSHNVPDPVPSDIPHVYLYQLLLNPEDEDAKRWAKEAENAHMRYYKAVQPNLFDIAI